MSIKLFYFYCVVCILFISSTTSSFALTRDERIQKEMDCIQDRIKQENNLAWGDVCYTSDKVAADTKEEGAYATSYETEPVIAEGSIDTNQIGVASKEEGNFKKQDFEIGPSMQKYLYEEPGVMRDKGYMYGFYGLYRYKFSDNKDADNFKELFIHPKRVVTALKIDGDLHWGNVDYDSNGTGSLDDIEYYKYEVRGTGEYDIPVSDTFVMTPFLGVGFRYLDDSSGGLISSCGAIGYERESKYLYLPMGMDFALNPKKGWKINIILEYDLFLEGKQKSHLEDTGMVLVDGTDGSTHNPDPISNKQDDGYGYRVSVRLTKESKWLDFFVEPYVRIWKIEESEHTQLTSEGGSSAWYYELSDGTQVPVLFYEPKNETTECGLKLGVKF